MDLRRKTVLLLLTLSIQALLLSGCWDSTEVNNLAIITAIGLDQSEDHQMELSVKIYLTSPASPQQMGGFSSDSGGAGRSIVRSVKGLTMAAAAAQLQQVLTRKVFWGQAEVLVIGESLAKEGIGEPMEYFTRHPAPRERVHVLVSKTTAKDVLRLEPPIERSIAKALREMAESQTGLSITIKELLQMIAGKSRAAVIPLVQIEPEQGAQEAFPFLNGTAVLKNGKMVGRMNDNATRGVLWLRNEIKRATTTISPKNADGYISFQLLRSYTELVPHIQGNDWSVTVRFNTIDDIVENTTDLDLADPKYVKQLETELGAVIEHRANMALTQAQKEMKADIFGFADAFYHKYPKEWNRNKNRWDEIYPNLKVKLETNPKISRPGMTGKSIFKPKQE
ncbi:Ger(x)C family spore germination protein [Paenibacillus thermoaerophilus]|uniref:Ger(X)C family spore germination protein n=1 Tax=Paenibacillus thermoaerophilus TaxID=1215385 RepID=A0ABW2V7J6_9BACL|nr:Ger(x)C family spore germination protein [Paenibacillus thermoaerophilus]TMV18860.1 Ger(x)C family spore germination protein [Paenibacillus thermoaerophilus]